MTVSPQAINIKFGSELRKRREQAGLTQRQLAHAVHLSQGQISALERGAKGTREDHVLRIDQLLSAEGVLHRRWQDGRSRGRGFAPWFVDVVAVEEEAREIRQYHPTLIPGLLQTESYARAIIRSGMPPDNDKEIEELVQGRLRRQKILTSDHPPWYKIVLDEPWLHRPSGGHDVMYKQLELLIKSSLLPRVTIQVIPTDTKHHPGHDGAFELFTVEDKGEFVYLETIRSSSSWDDPDTVNDYKKIFGELRGAALPEDASRELLKTIMGEFQ